MPHSPRLLSAVLVAALALPVAGCGESDKGLLSSRQAENLKSELERAESALADENCNGVRQAALAGSERAAGMDGIDAELRNNLVEGFDRLSRRADTDCDKAEKTPTPEATVEETATPEPTVEATATPVPTATEVPTEVPTVVVTPEPTVDTGGTEGDLEESP